MTNHRVSAAPPRALLIGGSISGLLAGHMLRAMGWQVDVFERVDGPLEGRGAGITILPGLPEAFAAAGVTERRLGIDLPSRLVLDREGATITERGYEQPMTSWTRLFELLKAPFPAERYHKGMNLERYEQDGERVCARFSDGTLLEADLLIGADGLRSTVRGQVAPQTKAYYAGYLAWRCLVDETALSPAAHKLLSDRYTICAAPGEQAIAYPVPGPNYSYEPGKRQINVVWYHPASDETLRHFCTDDRGVHHANGIPPGLLRAEVRQEMIDIAQRNLAPLIAETIARSPVHFFQAIYDVEPSRMADGRVAVVGDAAFIARPHTAMGVSKAGGDVLALAQALEACNGDHPAALRAFEAERVPINRAIVARGRYLGQYMQAQLGSDAERREAEAMRTPDYILQMAMPYDYK